ncbi:MAG TPA: Rieske 2Fe-2S domain-containing protein [Spongiibacteraceae bacterium]|jgi:3-ketosteroid 9alpha-monooxygenase subunit A|nr:Rieske 2Fe-2S domain-containing protein [Spongiibacteraceae bacterium]HUH39081.1 Rieske 2Fe-2S domain-containing protein [Spongiibacteraceae bacterium]
MSEDLSQSSAATVQRNMQTIPRLPDGSPRHARGWHMVGWSDEFEVNQPVARDYFGMRLVIYRTENGELHCLEAFCPHLGADLSAGKILDGGILQCPFHNWQFDGSGQCVHIPYSDKIPPRAKARAFPVIEINDTILVWHDPERGEPDYPVPPLDEFLSERSPLSNGWSKGWHRFKIRIKTHAREVVENIVDRGHLKPIHGFEVDEWLPVWDKHISGELMWGKHTRLAADVPDDKLYVRNITHGPAYQYTWQIQDSGQFDSLILTAWCPVDETTLDYWFGVIVKADPKQFNAEQLNEVAKGYCKASYDAFMEDVYIWERKLYRPEPVLCAGDGPIAKLRRWHDQFYTDRAEVNNQQFKNANKQWSVQQLRDEQQSVLAANSA